MNNDEGFCYLLDRLFKRLDELKSRDDSAVDLLESPEGHADVDSLREKLIDLWESAPKNHDYGICLPVIIPSTEEKFEGLDTKPDLGFEMECYFAALNYEPTRHESTEYESTNDHLERLIGYESYLEGLVAIEEGSRHKELFERMWSGRPVPALYFPDALKGSIHDVRREQMASVPEGFVLSGLDVIIANFFYPCLHLFNRNLPALSRGPSGDSLIFRTFEGESYFNAGISFLEDLEDGLNGLLFIGR